MIAGDQEVIIAMWVAVVAIAIVAALSIYGDDDDNSHL